MESFSFSPLTGGSRYHLKFRTSDRSIDPGAMGSHASTGTVCVCALIHQTLILIFRTLIQLIFSCVLIIADNRQNNYFCMSVKLEVIWYNNIHMNLR